MSLSGVLARKGATVVFSIRGSGGIYDPLTGLTSGGAAPSTVVGQAMQIAGDPDRFEALNLVLVNPVTLLVSAQGLSLVPVPGMAFTWAGIGYTTRDVEPCAMNGVPTAYRVTGSV